MYDKNLLQSNGDFRKCEIPINGDFEGPFTINKDTKSRLNRCNPSCDQGCGDAQKHADECSFDVEPIVVVGSGHVLRAWNDEMLVVAKPDTVQHQRVEPVHYHSEGVGCQSAA